MADPPCLRVLITGANTGLGLAICKRLIDEFFLTRPPTHTLHLLLTTRSISKSTSTIRALQTHASRSPSLKARAEPHLRLSAYEADLCSLPQILTAAGRIRADIPSEEDGGGLDVLVANAGISGWTGLDWGMAVRDILRAPIQSMTWPQFNIGSLGWRTKPQIPTTSSTNNKTRTRRGRGAVGTEADEEEDEEPPLGQVFCANVFGHYLLTYLLRAELGRGGGGGGNVAGAGRGRVVWTSSVSTHAHTLRLDDIQCLDRADSYDSSKRLTDMLVLPSELPALRRLVDGFWGTGLGGAASGADNERTHSRPGMYVSHPGVTSTDIMPLPWILIRAKELAFYAARWLGSPWHVVTPAKGAVSAVWLVLAAQTTLDEMEASDGKGKWGSATDVWGRERVRRTETEGWGYGGIVGAEEKFGRSGRRAGTRDLTRGELEEFVGTAERCWQQMESMRKGWLERLKGVVVEE